MKSKSLSIRIGRRFYLFGDHYVVVEVYSQVVHLVTPDASSVHMICRVCLMDGSV